MRLEALKYLFDIQQACRLLAMFIAGKAFADYSSDARLRSGVERQLTIVGEALNRLTKIEPTAITKITDARQIIAFRNILVHGYEIVRDEVVWSTLESELPTLIRQVDTFSRQETYANAPRDPQLRGPRPAPQH